MTDPSAIAAAQAAGVGAGVALSVATIVFGAGCKVALLCVAEDKRETLILNCVGVACGLGLGAIVTQTALMITNHRAPIITMVGAVITGIAIPACRWVLQTLTSPDVTWSMRQ